MIKKLIIKRALFAVILLFSAHVVFAQSMGSPKAIVVPGVYTHSQTKKEFPKYLVGYKRHRIYAFDKIKSNIGAVYNSKKGKTTISVYLYPAGEGSEDRLRNEYLSAFREVVLVSLKGITTNHVPTFYAKDGYKVNGIRTHIAGLEDRSRSYLSVFECGKWFFKLRITSALLDTTEIINLEREILNEFAPTDFVKQSPLIPEATIYLAPAARADSLIAVASMGSAFKKIQWANENVDSLERAAGFPSLYLELHVASLTEFVRQEQVKQEIRQKWTMKPETAEYLSELNRIIASGYLREFIMDQYDRIMIVPENVTLDFKSYRQWTLAQPVRISLDERFYVISYAEE
ncbi:hypothetical protein MKJ04_11240 [Pontibacter sp. E15-1]|uniref:hypothetical protein n=1 Tax=Pontibacter sp. E15-1 TaxID=2919918 RepID=UPI001F4F4329|nr:hypothetical protein [Pontibacter sp. E15-1]MCJ8165418.1 hypothetical protein [Pontibacter sp. E15-1]